MIKYEVGQEVRIRDNTCGHYFHMGEIVTIRGLKEDGRVDSCFNGEDRWYLDEDDIEPIAQVVAVKVLKERPAGKLLYAVVNKDGIQEIEQDRDDARFLKAELGGLKAGVTIVQYAPVKEIR